CATRSAVTPCEPISGTSGAPDRWKTPSITTAPASPKTTCDSPLTSKPPCYSSEICCALLALIAQQGWTRPASPLRCPTEPWQSGGRYYTRRDRVLLLGHADVDVVAFDAHRIGGHILAGGPAQDAPGAHVELG